MAEAFAKHISRGIIHVESAGLYPLPVHPLSIEVMKEIGIDISNQVSNGIDMRTFVNSNVIIRIGDYPNEKSTVIPFAFGVYSEQWNIVNPVTDLKVEACMEDFRKIRNEVHDHVRELLRNFMRIS